MKRFVAVFIAQDEQGEFVDVLVPLLSDSLQAAEEVGQSFHALYVREYADEADKG